MVKKYTIILGFILTIINVNGQKIDFSDELINQIENPKYSRYSLKKENSINKFGNYDFSTLFVPRNEFLGYIGEDFKRIKIYYTSISKDSANSMIYHIKGLSVVEDNKCDFDGIIKVVQIRELKQMHFGIDDSYKNAGFKGQGILIGEYELKENPNQKHAGSFQGTMTLSWYIDRYGILHYDDLTFFSDSYTNNQYAGIWKSYLYGLDKTCNWGERRIPFSNDLDIGTAEFSPNPKYKNKGWSDLMIK